MADSNANAHGEAMADGNATAQVRLGFLGTGGFAQSLADAAVRAGIVVASCYSPTQAKRAAFAGTFGAAAADSQEQLLADPGIDAVLIASPHSTHVELIEAAAAAGKHVFVEKPLALTAAGARRAIEVTTAAGVILQVGHNRRRQPATRRIKAMIDAGELGTVLQAEAFFAAPGGWRTDIAAWRTDPDECPAGGMTALGVHMVDTLHYLLGPAASVQARSKQVIAPSPADAGLDHATSAIIEYAAGPIATLSTSYYSAPGVRFAVYGTDAAAWSDDDGARLLVQQRSEPARREVPVEVLDTLQDELADFARTIRDGADPETGGPAGLEVAAILDAIVTSSASGAASPVHTG